MSKEKYIPTNHGEGQAVAGYIVKTRNLIEGILMGGIPFFLVMYWTIGLSISTRVTLAAVISCPLLILGINGINGDAFTVFIKTWVKFKRRRRILFYNPRVKTELLPLVLERDKEELLPREKLAKFVEAKKDLRKTRRISKNELALTQTEDGFVFFEDDIGILEKPDDYKTDKEIRAEKRRKKKLKNGGSKDVRNKRA